MQKEQTPDAEFSWIRLVRLLFAATGVGAMVDASGGAAAAALRLLFAATGVGAVALIVYMTFAMWPFPVYTLLAVYAAPVVAFLISSALFGGGAD